MTVFFSEQNMILIYALLCVAAGFICFSGYKVYHLALAMIGFAVGFSRVEPYLGLLNLDNGTRLIIQLIVAIICAILSWSFVRVGVFMAAYHFARENLSAMLSEMLARKLELPEVVYPIFAIVAGGVIAWIIAWLVVKSERIVVVLITSILGAYGAVFFLRSILPLIPADIDAFINLPALVWLAAVVLLALAGAFAQGLLKRK